MILLMPKRSIIYPAGRLANAYGHIKADSKNPISAGGMLKAAAISVFAILKVDLSK
jgi:hypothetical protein